ncbi:hypothetical protein AB4144_28525, partial [Rhizobiaceae sp. 2RAB30]
ALHASTTRSGPEIRNIGADTTGRLRRPDQAAGNGIAAELLFGFRANGVGHAVARANARSRRPLACVEDARRPVAGGLQLINTA